MSQDQMQGKLMQMVNGLNMPLSVSSQTGAIRSMEDRIRKIQEGSVQSMGSCNPPYSSWGN